MTSILRHAATTSIQVLVVMADIESTPAPLAVLSLFPSMTIEPEVLGFALTVQSKVVFQLLPSLIGQLTPSLRSHLPTVQTPNNHRWSCSPSKVTWLTPGSRIKPNLI